MNNIKITTLFNLYIKKHWL